MENHELPNNFKLTGAGLESELSAFIEHMTSINPTMAEVFANHLPALKEASTEDLRRIARASFNASAKADLLKGLNENAEEQN